MGYNEIIGSYYQEITNLVILMEKYVNSYRLLVGAAGELNNIALAKKTDVRKALKRADKLGDLIDEILKILECTEYTYLNFVKIKSDILVMKTEKDLILTEIDNELLFQNSKRFDGKDGKFDRKLDEEFREEERTDFDGEFPTGFIEEIKDKE
ncbi:hypothetical protein [Clostridium sp. 'White wine YQ']|uniref:hypothetical protein n=1 Tax=Clostridium sp. 'White wine YQ' TaxID=3027474 RepID=UPI002366D2A3|nr:hypothetical protein [Clostridium sp. 'White wine YQ']MDD7792798.1 hypothetical protein [Clostridium sp. 'White wine YQ']